MDGLDAWLTHPIAAQALGLAALVAGVVLLHFLTRRVLVAGIERAVRGSRSDWDDALHEARVFEYVVAVVPLLLAWWGVALVPELSPTIVVVVRRVALAWVLLTIARALIALLSASNQIYLQTAENVDRPIKGYVQVVQIAIGIVTGVLILATLLDRSPLIFLSGIGAMTAVLLLVFRDTILSFVASLQISGQDMVRVGDWIEMPQYGADGDVVDVALHTVKVQNWDKTITTIPTHKLISDSFKNWRYMTLSGGRRIKRAIHLDVDSVRFLEPDEVEHFRGFALLRDYVERKSAELEQWNRDRDPAVNANVRRLTNLGTFRAYVREYLRAHPGIHSEGMTLLVRQLAPGPTGIPLEVYCFTKTTDWGEYEGIQADLFEHFSAIAPDFGLRIFQSPSGADLRALGSAG